MLKQKPHSIYPVAQIFVYFHCIILYVVYIMFVYDLLHHSVVWIGLCEVTGSTRVMLCSASSSVL